MVTPKFAEENRFWTTYDHHAPNSHPVHRLRSTSALSSAKPSPSPRRGRRGDRGPRQPAVPAPQPSVSRRGERLFRGGREAALPDDAERKSRADDATRHHDGDRRPQPGDQDQP